MYIIEISSGLVIFHAILAVVAVFSAVLSLNLRISKMVQGLTTAVIFLQSANVVCQFIYSPIFNRAAYLQIFVLILAVLSFVLWKRKNFSKLALVFMPLVLIFSLIANFIPESNIVPDTHKIFFTKHLVCIFAALVFISMNFGLAVLFLIQERMLKKKDLLNNKYGLPAITWLDNMSKIITMLGFITYSLGILFGLVAARASWGEIFSGDPKEIISIVIWLIFAFLVHQRYAKNWRGRKPAILAIVIFGLTIISLFIVNFILPTHHSFIGG